jgi:hypothetical protein
MTALATPRFGEARRGMAVEGVTSNIPTDDRQNGGRTGSDQRAAALAVGGARDRSPDGEGTRPADRHHTRVQGRTRLPNGIYFASWTSRGPPTQILRTPRQRYGGCAFTHR